MVECGPGEQWARTMRCSTSVTITPTGVLPENQPEMPIAAAWKTTRRRDDGVIGS
jgi:hypothetical protein